MVSALAFGAGKSAGASARKFSPSLKAFHGREEPLEVNPSDLSELLDKIVVFVNTTRTEQGRRIESRYPRLRTHPRIARLGFTNLTSHGAKRKFRWQHVSAGGGDYFVKKAFSEGLSSYGDEKSSTSLYCVTDECRPKILRQGCSIQNCAAHLAGQCFRPSRFFGRIRARSRLLPVDAGAWLGYA